MSSVSEESFAGALRASAQPSYRLALAILREEQVAVDAVQGAAVTAWRRRESLGSVAAFGPWFMAFVVAECRSIRRTKWLSDLRVPLHAELPSLGRAHHDPAHGPVLAGALRQQGADGRLALYLGCYLDLPAEDAAQVMSCSRAAFRWRLGRAVSRLRQESDLGSRVGDLGGEIKAAFDAEGEDRGEVAGLGDSIAAVPSARGTTRRSPIPGAAAVVALGLVAGGGLLPSSSNRARPPAPPHPAVSSAPSSFVGDVTPAVISPSPETDYGPPPRGLALIYYIDPRRADWLVALDWTGTPRGTVKLTQPSSSGRRASPSVNPDGSTYLAGGIAYDLAGGSLGVVGSEQDTPLWADDNRHLCGMSPEFSDGVEPVAQRLYTVLPGKARLPVARVGTAGSQAGAHVGACSLASKTAIVVQAYNDVASQSWLVSLTTGAVVHHQAYGYEGGSGPGARTDSVRLVMSRDARLIAENHYVSYAGSGNPAQRGPTLVRDARTGRLVATMPVGTEILGFSSDGTQALVTTTGGDVALQVRDWRRGGILYEVRRTDLPDPADSQPGFMSAEPGGPGFLVGYERRIVPPCGDPSNGCGLGGYPSYDLLLLRVGAQPTTVAKGVDVVAND